MTNAVRAVVLLSICVAGCGRPDPTSEPRPPASLPMPARPEPPAPVWRVVSVHDGDTLRAIDEGKVEHKIRLHGIDAPEIGQPFGNVSRDGLTWGYHLLWDRPPLSWEAS
jgi:endonuclease YncB( thermonuclease family)